MEFQRQKYLFAWLPKPTIARYMQDKCTPQCRATLPEIMKKWTRASKKFEELEHSERGVHRTMQTEELNSELVEKIKEITNNNSFKNSIGAIDYEFKMVEIDKLITTQVCIYLDHVDKLITKITKPQTVREIFDLCLSLEKEYPPVSRIKRGENVIIYSSDSPDFRYIGTYSMPSSEAKVNEEILTAIPTNYIISMVGYGLPLVSVLKIHDNYVLDNGFHRLYALRSLGVKKVPALVKKINFLAELPNKYTENHIEDILSRARPPLMKDYFDPDLTIDLKTVPTKQVVKIEVKYDQGDVPL